MEYYIFDVPNQLYIDKIIYAKYSKVVFYSGTSYESQQSKVIAVKRPWFQPLFSPLWIDLHVNIIINSSTCQTGF